ncbi:small cell adhesion glycoprotein homolog [Limanda limanda]|uniref:small cell adhesion glycoprotein homolog n=1 Tax=Limanda limanda TaxID=27771 RepID=UPI0029C96A0C|nr:small cell adhesion glycoprotein homolog [Limanda limanda]XP_060923143.1 small cell adhesion glycoprotein homolog [Limanda limanda]XP_060923145.1 small cell adhesion glycoprotein homolog [Limanda limanda]
MNASTASVPMVPMGLVTHAPTPEAVTKMLMQDVNSGNGELAALIGGIVGAVLLALICVIAVLMWCLSRHKGSYITNEMDDDDDIDNDDEEPFCSDMMLQANKPLMIDEDEESRMET